MVSPDGTDEPQCLNYSTNTACKTLRYPIQSGFSSLCMQGTFYNLSVDIVIDQQHETHVLCKGCSLIDSEINLSCNRGMTCSISFQNFSTRGCTIKLSYIYITFRNAILEDTIIHNYSNLSESAGYNEVRFENSTLSCYEPTECGFHLANTNAAKLVFSRSHLNSFRLDISVSQLMLTFYETDIIIPSINVKVRSFEYLKIPTIIRFENVTLVRSRALLAEKQVHFKVKRQVDFEPLDCFIAFDVTNPDIVVKDSSFIEVHLEIQSKKQYFNPSFFSISFERNSFMKSYHVGEGGAVTIISEVQNSKLLVTDCVFFNNSAVKGSGNMKGKGGGLYVEAKSLTLEMASCDFLDNWASDSGLALYTTKGVDVSLTNCTFQYSLDPNAQDPIQQSLLFVSGKVMEFQGLFHVFNPKPESYIGNIDVFYIGQGANLNIETHCPKWYNHEIEYTPVATENKGIPDAHYKCSPCSDNYYSPGVEITTLSYDGNRNVTLEEQLKRNRARGRCEECPYGAICTGNNVMPRPNYWGYWHEGELEFQQCPADYCCSGNEDSICSVYNYCAGNRTGTLCGACREGFSVSILTGECTPDSECGGQWWFWLIAFLATVAYALWYTLKNDIFALFFGSIRLIKRLCNRSKKNEEYLPASSSKGSVSTFQNIKNIVTIHDAIDDGTNENNESVENVMGKNDATDNAVNDAEVSEDTANNDDIDKGYFGIVTYYVQMAAVISIQIEFSDIDQSESYLEKIVNFISQFLNLELTKMTFNVCPIVGLTTLGRHVYNLAFLVGIFVSWAVLFTVTFIITSVVRKGGKSRSVGFDLFKLRLVGGVIEIIKYTYAAFCGLIFMSLVCTEIGNKSVWLHDGTNTCLENWQIVIAGFAVFYAVPFPLTLMLAMKLLKQNKMSPAVFVCCCLVPLLALVAMLVYICFLTQRKKSKAPKDAALSDASETVISVLQGPYREDKKHLTLYWEAMVSVRRLLITGMTLVPYASIRMLITTALCLIFLAQHIFLKPFLVKSSNYIEALSLLLLSMASVINLLKSSLTDEGVIPSGPTVPFFKSVELFEKMFVLIIIAFIIAVEFKSMIGGKRKTSKA